MLTQPSVVKSDSLPEFRRNFPLMEDSGAEGDYVLEAARPSDRVPFRAGEGVPHFLWVYQELFTRLRIRLPFSDFQRDMMTCCRVAVSQLHLNGWALFSPLRKCAYTMASAPPSDSFSIFMTSTFLRVAMGTFPSGLAKAVLAAPGKHAFWLDHEDKPFSWVYWNPEVKDFTVYNLEPLEMAAFKFLVSLPGGLPKRNKFTCRWILDSSDAEVGKYLDDLLDVKMKRTKLDNLMAMMADLSRMGLRAVLPTGGPSATATAAVAAAAASASAAAGSTPMESSSQVPPALTASKTHRTKKQSSKRDLAKVVNLEGEEGLQEDPAADLQQKRRKKKAKVDDAFEKALEEDSDWEHDVDPLKVAFLESFNYRKALNVGLTSAPVREALTKMPPEQLLGESYHLSAKSLACLQVGVETSLAAKVKAEKELSATLDQIEVLKGETDSALVYLPLKEKVDNLDDQLSERIAEY
ncbi:hypothetical protein PIB30_034666 [Stylosanthes scabra]|uniref:Uncharacterized protein n=1 Tax=Stylosanthes scabra TaxID=79078 RepID=A0ABU6QDI4_9FABA|nr:hypothetical protein [Stylosanthes scabra]